MGCHWYIATIMYYTELKSVKNAQVRYCLFCNEVVDLYNLNNYRVSHEKSRVFWIKHTFTFSIENIKKIIIILHAIMFKIKEIKRKLLYLESWSCGFYFSFI